MTHPGVDKNLDDDWANIFQTINDAPEVDELEVMQHQSR